MTPYNSAKGITVAKYDWEEANKRGDEAGKARAQESAKAFYDELVAIGRPELADAFHNANYEEAAKMTKSLHDYENNNQPAGGDVQTLKPVEVQPASEPANETPKDRADKAYEDYMKEASKDPYESEWGRAILNQYLGKAESGRDGALGEYTASNGGNIDSFSAAHARRVYNDILGTAIDKIETHEAERQARLLNRYNALVGTEFGFIDREQAEKDSERNAETQKELAKIDADTIKYQTDVNADVTNKGYETEERMNTANNETVKYQTDADKEISTKNIEAEERMNAANNAESRYQTDVNAGVARDGYAAEERMNERDNFTEIALNDNFSPDVIANSINVALDAGHSKEDILKSFEEDYGKDSQIYKTAKALLDDGDNAPTWSK